MTSSFVCVPADSDASPAAIFINEFDPRSFERLFQNRKSCSARFGDIRFDLANCHNAQPCTIGEFLLRNSNQEVLGLLCTVLRSPSAQYARLNVIYESQKIDNPHCIDYNHL